MNVRVAVAQTSPRLGDVEANLAAAEEVIAGVAGQTDLIVFPELFTTGYRREGMDHGRLAEPLDGTSVTRLSRAASASGTALVGTILEAGAGEVFDTAIVIAADGSLAGAYRKTHLYPAERAHFAAGERLVVADAAGTRVGLAICFEHAFPEIFAELALGGAEIIAIPSAVPVGFEYLLELRTRSRAQDNQVYVVAANIAGSDGVAEWAGGSMIVGPRGEILAAAGGDASAVITADLDLASIARERLQEPVLTNRRPELYSRLRGGTTDP